MSEHEGETGSNSGNGGDGSERLAAHERLSTGALARWTRACATHPWRVVFELGRHRRVADRPRRDGRRQPEGRVRDPGLGHAEGDRPDRVGVRLRAGRRPEPRLRRARGRAAGHARAQGGDRGRDREAQDRRVQADRGQGRHRERRRPVRPEHVLGRRPHRLRGGAVRRRSSTTKDRDRVVAVEDAVRADGRAGRRDRRVQRRRRVPADRAGDAGAARPACGAHRAARRLPHLRRDGDPDRARADGASGRRSSCSSSSPA